MTRKDFEILADIVARMPQHPNTISYMCGALGKQFPNFNVDKFRSAVHKISLELMKEEIRSE